MSEKPQTQESLLIFVINLSNRSTVFALVLVLSIYVVLFIILTKFACKFIS